MKDIAIVDPYPRTMELIFSKPKLIELKNKFWSTNVDFKWKFVVRLI